MASLSPAMRRALQKAASVAGLYHEFSNTSTVNALRTRRLIRAEGPPGWYVATDVGRAFLSQASEPAAKARP